jgi:hypothetical protein
MSRIRDIASILTSASVLSTDVETSAAITSAINALPPGYGRGNTASRPVSPTVGDIYVNTQTGFVEIYESTGWSQVGGIASTVTAVTATDSPSGRSYNNGAAAITFTPGTILGKTYVVTSSPGSYTASGTASPITITGLQSSTQYTYTVVASNNYGTASASSASSAVTATTVPQAPTIGTATGGNAQVSVAFSANATGGSSITGYTITSSPGNITASGSTSPVLVTGLTNGTAYTFTITATNANGTSTASAASNSVTPVATTVSGGTLSSDATYYYRTFASSGSLLVSGSSISADILKIAGGGTGGRGGGGAGGLVYLSSQSLSPNTYSATIGAGGTARTSDYGGASPSGSPSQLGSLTAAVGGGGGAGYSANGASGGCGGGAGWGSGTSYSGGSGSQGGNGSGTGGSGPSGGGGGTGASTGSRQGGNGSDTYSSWITAINSSMSGVSGWSTATSGGRIGGGGSGGGDNSGSSGILAGGGGGGGTGSYGGYSTPNNGGNFTSGSQNTGGGGGGGWYVSENGSYAGYGGSGIIIVRYLKSAVGG